MAPIINRHPARFKSHYGGIGTSNPTGEHTSILYRVEIAGAVSDGGWSLEGDSVLRFREPFLINSAAGFSALLCSYLHKKER